jgi:hypothetical protein
MLALWLCVVEQVNLSTLALSGKINLLSFFTYAVDNQLDGTRSYLESVQARLFQDEASGLIGVVASGVVALLCCLDN